MKIVTILKQVPDAEARVRTSGGEVDLGGVTFVIDGMDEYGVEEALRIREERRSRPRWWCWRSGRSASRRRSAPPSPWAPIAPCTSRPTTRSTPSRRRACWRTAIQQEAADLVLVGGKEADWDSAALGAAVAEALGWAHSDWTTELRLEGGRLHTRHDTDDGSEALSLPLPAVVTTQQGLNEPRYPTLPNIMKAKRKELAKTTLQDYGGAEALTTTLEQTIQTRERIGKVLQGDPGEAARELVRLLADEAKVLS